MRALVVAAVVVIAGAVGAVLLLRDGGCEGDAITIYDGAAVPGSPQTAEAALDAFLAEAPRHLANRNRLPADPDDYAFVMESPDHVTFRHENVVISIGRRQHGWFVDESRTVC